MANPMDATNEVMNVGGNALSTIWNRVAKPAAAIYGVASIYGAMSTGGVSALPDLANRAVVGVSEAASHLTTGMEWATAKLSAATAAPIAPAP